MLRFLFFTLLVRPFVMFAIGCYVRGKHRLPMKGPAIVVANHNSHLDALVLLCLHKWWLLPKVRPVAAADYFLRNKYLAWFALDVIGIIPIERKKVTRDTNPMQDLIDRLDEGRILILFPEGQRGLPEEMAEMKSGVAHILKYRPEVPVIPVYIYGLGRALPRGEALFVPFFCDVYVGKRIRWNNDKRTFMAKFEMFLSEMKTRARADDRLVK